MSGECEKFREHALESVVQANKCVGLLGNIFGHSFRRYLVKEKYIQKPYISFEVTGTINVLAFLESQRDLYSIKCKRCGLELK